LFDVFSHMGQAVVAGPNAAHRLETLVVGEIATLSPGQMRYTLMLNEEGHILAAIMQRFDGCVAYPSAQA
jgi:aminomethyltransferase